MENTNAAEVQRVVTTNDTASEWGAEFPAAASTPFVLGLAEVACHRAVESLLSDGEITVGTSATIEHLAASKVGATLSATALLIERKGRRLNFEAKVHDGKDLVATVLHTRAIVDAQVINARLA